MQRHKHTLWVSYLCGRAVSLGKCCALCELCSAEPNTAASVSDTQSLCTLPSLSRHTLHVHLHRKPASTLNMGSKVYEKRESPLFFSLQLPATLFNKG